MGIQVVRFNQDGKEQWGVVSEERILVLPKVYQSLAEFLEQGIEEARKVKETGTDETVSLGDVEFLSPVTKPARIICQGTNYATHRSEAGLDAKRAPFNLFFSKADSALCGANSEIVRPEHVKLLDYEIELGLIIGENITGPVEVTDDNLHQYIAGVVIVDDVSARDVQFTEGQWLKGKSYRTFAPAGPFLYLLDPEEVPKIHNLELNLWVNDELRQSANSCQLLYKPAETLTELSEIMDLSKGDLILTGTTGGVALNISPEVNNRLADSSLTAQQRVEIILESQQKNNARYLKEGDIVRCQIKSPDGSIDLGEQRNKVVTGSKEPVGL
ncbi:fumarylacetoacetate hydrolase family protein [Neobacillus vireti]|uniref:fumarylacetoacetate hydrolase family protein n=1 Tax=Neobacillus vireti TaxID=220686 RepID=UPI00300048DF